METAKESGLWSLSQLAALLLSHHWIVGTPVQGTSHVGYPFQNSIHSLICSQILSAGSRGHHHPVISSIQLTANTCHSI
jgi:hypothetical protein